MHYKNVKNPRCRDDSAAALGIFTDRLCSVERILFFLLFRVTNSVADPDPVGSEPFWSDQDPDPIKCPDPDQKWHKTNK